MNENEPRDSAVPYLRLRDLVHPVRAEFADVFLNLDPNAGAAVTRAELLAVLPRRHQLFAAVGGIGADLTDIHETVLDERHTLVRAAWQMRFDCEHEDAEPLTLHSSFPLRAEDGWRVVLHLGHQDGAALLAARRESTADAA